MSTVFRPQKLINTDKPCPVICPLFAYNSDLSIPIHRQYHIVNCFDRKVNLVLLSCLYMFRLLRKLLSRCFHLVKSHQYIAIRI